MNRFLPALAAAFTGAAFARATPPAPDVSTAELLLQWQFNPLTWSVALLALGVYFVQFFRHRRAGAGVAGTARAWPAWRAALFTLGVLVALFSLDSNAVSYTMNSMALYMGRLMLLAELAPPLLVLGLPGALITLKAREGLLGRALNFLLDPIVVFALWTTIIVYWNLPSGFNASLVSATAGGLLPVLYLLGGILVWAVVLRPMPSLQAVTVGGRAWFGLLASLPMMTVAMVWLYSPNVLYSPYVGVPCLWDLTPLQNQQISGWVMMAAGLPAMAIAVFQLLAWLLALMDSGTVIEEPEVIDADVR